MNAEALLARLLQSNVCLWFEGDDFCFRAPRNTVSPELRSLVSENKAALKSLMGQNIRYLRASDAQESVWLFQQFTRDPVLNLSSFSFELHGALRQEVLQAALEDVAARHEPLRTHFRIFEGVLAQVITPTRDIPIQLSDLSSDSLADNMMQVRRAVEVAIRAPFDLERGPLIRAHLFIMTPEHYIFVLPMHHSISDGWSMGVLFKDLFEAYEARGAGTAPAWTPLQTTFSAFIQAQRTQQHATTISHSLDFWRVALQEVPKRLEMPVQTSIRDRSNMKGDEVLFTFSGELAGAVKNFSVREGSTVFMVLLAAYQALLYRYSGQPRFTVGVPVAGRPDRELYRLVGFFVNTIVMTADFTDTPTFRALVARVRDTVLQAFEHQHVPFKQLVVALNPDRASSPSPLFNVSFALHNMPGPRPGDTGLQLKRYPVHPGAVQFDLHLSLKEFPEGFRGSVEFHSSLFDTAEAALFARYYTALLEDGMARPDVRIDELQLWSQEEAFQKAAAWNDTRRGYPRQSTVHGLVEKWSLSTPEAIAIQYREKTLTYARLNEQAGVLARNLAVAGVRPGAIVAVDMERGIELIVALLAVLKAGAAYLPLDRNAPCARSLQLMRDAGASLLLTDPERAAGLSEDHPPGVMILDEESVLESRHGNPLSIDFGGEALAYVLYTSGSTGMPKGVCVEHRAIVNLTQNENYGRVCPADVVAQASQPAFDASTFEIWGALTNGARLVIIPRDILLEGHRLKALLLKHHISVMLVTTALLNHYAYAQPDLYASLKILVFGGEMADPAAVAAILHQGAPRRLVHLYGPTEATTYTTFHVVDKIAKGARRVSIGQPIANVYVYVMDEHRGLVPPGLPGELYIGGDGLARGYLKDAERMRERFTAVPSPPFAGTRLYRTGDVVLQRPDGSLDFVGRKDRQVKLSGFRIEPAEIEHVLRRHPMVTGAAVELIQEQTENNYLVAYVTVRSGACPENAELLRYLRQQVPAYMLPRACIVLDRFPITANGKLDRASLPRPEMVAEAVHHAPKTPLEIELAALVSELLGIPHVGAHDNFFEIGGNSLAAMRWVARIRERYGVSWPVQALFEWPTVAGAAAWIQRHTAIRPDIDVQSLSDEEVDALLVRLLKDHEEPA